MEKNWKRVGKKGFYFTIDALFGAALLLIGLLVISRAADVQSGTEVIEHYAEDIINALGSMTLQELYYTNNTLIIQEYAAGNITDLNKTAIEQIGEYWALGESAKASGLASSIVAGSLPDKFSMSLTAGGEVLYIINSTSASDITTTRKMIAGIAASKPITGAASSAYLRKIQDKRTAQYIYFGGFVGQGNITAVFPLLPSDANITGIHLEIAAGSPFTLAFNGVNCDGTYSPSSLNGSPDAWDVSGCNSSWIEGIANNVSMRFSGPSNESYIAGGFLRVKYKTNTLYSTFNSSFQQYSFPGIHGVINLFDSFYVPGTLTSMAVFLHINATNSSNFNIGEKRVWEDFSNGTEKMVYLNDSYLTDPALGKLDYAFLSQKTIPIRLAGFSPNQTVLTSGDADIVIITDFSGSMKKAVADWDQGNLGGDCNTAYSDSEIRRTLLAQCVDGIFVDSLLNYSGNRIWPVMIYKNDIDWYNNPSNAAAINGWINSYANGADKTCYACSLNMAYDILKNLSNSTRKKFVVFMSDGTPTHCASGGCASNSTSYGTQQCAGMCDTSGSCDADDIPSACSECIANPGGQANAYSAAQRLHSELNATIFTVGFGPVTDCSFANATLNQLASIGNGTYQHSDDSGKLKVIYENISQEILTRTTLQAQVAFVEGGLSKSTLYPDSYINLTYTLASQYLPAPNKLSITLQTAPSCSPNLTLYSEQELVEANLLSYSGTHWSDYVSVNGVEAYNLSAFLVPYEQLGDPTLIHTASSLYSIGNNTLIAEIGDSPTNKTVCIGNNTLVYTASVALGTERSEVVPKAEGCKWIVQFEDNTFANITVPTSYSGSNACSYIQGGISYDDQDAYQVGAYSLFNSLDFTKSGKIFVNLQDQDLEVIVTTVGEVPYLWGPSLIEVSVWK